MWGRLIRQGPPRKPYPASPSSAAGSCGVLPADGEPPTRAARPHPLGAPVSLPIMSQLPVMSSLVGTSWLSSSSQSERVTQTGPGEAESDRSLYPGSRSVSRGGLDWEEGVVSQDSPQGGWLFLVLAAPLIATPPNPRRLWVQRGQGQWEESLILQQDGSGC